MQASAIAVPDAGTATAYSRFRAAVAQAQFDLWLAELARQAAAGPGDGAGPRGRRCRVIDISGPGAGNRAAELAALAGHAVVRVLPPGGHDAAACLPPRHHARLRAVTAEGGGLEFLASGSADAVIAEDRTLSRSLAAETLVSEIARVLRPGGRVLASVDSLTLGMSVLARQHHWPHLADLPRADVVLVPWPDGTITRCYGAEQLRELFAGSGFEVSWIRSRTFFARTTVSYLLSRDPGSFKRLLRAELRARGDDALGDELVISAALAR